VFAFILLTLSVLVHQEFSKYRLLNSLSTHQRPPFAAARDEGARLRPTGHHTAAAHSNHRLAAQRLHAADAAPAAGTDQLQVNVYYKPVDCDSGAVKSRKGDLLTIHYTGTIDQSSKTGDRTAKFDSSRDRASPFNFKVEGSVRAP
jgi:FKBP-type peptidyl-prolyl cis-trans isomerase